MPKVNRICSIEGCAERYYSKGFCRGHYHRWTKHGDPLAGRASPGSAESFLRDVVRPFASHECLRWPFSAFKGRAVIWRDGQNVAVTRLLCEEMYGPPPTPEHQAAHSCGKGHEACVNPAHISWKTPVENASDKVTHGTQNKGENHGRAKLSEEDVHRIRALPAILSARQIARQFGVSHTAVTLIRKGKNWAWLPPTA